MKRKPVYKFSDKNSTGIYDVPLNSIIIIENPIDLTYYFCGINKSFGTTAVALSLLNKNNVLGTTTIEQFLSDISNWSFLTQDSIQHVEDNHLYILTGKEFCSGDIHTCI